MVDNLPAGIVVPDTSVVLKWYLHEQEPERAQALMLRQAFLEGRIHLSVPELVFYEAANVLRYKPDWDSARVYRAIDSLFALRLKIVSASPASMRQAAGLAYKYDVAVYDAVFVALAEESGATFVTADQRLVRSLGGLPFVHLLADIPFPMKGSVGLG